MTRVDFYIIGDHSRQNRERILCSLAQKALNQGHRIHIHTADEQQANRLDNLLWTWNDVSFLPHAAVSEASADTPIHIGYNVDEPRFDDILINMADPAPGFFSRFERVLEIVATEPVERERARQRYRFYQDRGYPLSKHDV